MKKVRGTKKAKVGNQAAKKVKKNKKLWKQFQLIILFKIAAIRRERLEIF